MRPYVGNIILRKTSREIPWETMMPRNVPGVNDGASKITHVPIFLPADWMIKTDFTKRKDVARAGVGPVAKNIVDNIMIQ
jgi:hypothetical protein